MAFSLPADDSDHTIEQARNIIASRRVSTSTEGGTTPRTTLRQTGDDVETAINLAKAQDTPVWLRFSLEGTGQANGNKPIRFGKEFCEVLSRV